MSNTITIPIEEYERLKLAERLLEDLTPSGSEYHHNPKRCYDYVQATFKSNHEARVKLIKLNRDINNTNFN